MFESISQPDFWVIIAQIILIDILLGGDNAIVIALACRRLPERQRNLAIFLGTFGAVALRLVLLFFAVQLLRLEFLKIVGGLLLLWIGVKLMLPDGGAADEEKIDASTHLLGAIRTIVIADAVMSLDNVVAVAGAAQDDMALIIFGVAVSVPIILWGSKLVLKLMDRFPQIIMLGAALLGYIAGKMLVGDVVTKSWVTANAPWLNIVAPIAGALIVVVIGKWLTARRARVEELTHPPSGRAQRIKATEE